MNDGLQKNEFFESIENGQKDLEQLLNLWESKSEDLENAQEQKKG